MTKLTCEGLDCVGKTPVKFQLDRDLFPVELLTECARHVPAVSLDEHGGLTIDGPDSLAWNSLRDFCAQVIAARRALL